MQRRGDASAPCDKSVGGEGMHGDDRSAAQQPAELHEIPHLFSGSRDHADGGGLAVDHADGRFVGDNGGNGGGAVRPVITLSKVTLGDQDESAIDKENNATNVDKTDNKKESNIKVKVANTYIRKTLIIMMLGFVSAIVAIFIYYIIKNKKME